MGLFSRSVLQAQTAKAVDWLAANIFSLTGTFASSTLTASTALVSDASNNIISSAVTATELGFLSGVTSPLKFTTGDLTVQTAAVSSVTAITAPNDSAMHTFQVGAYLTVNAIVTDVIQVQVSYTDENSASQTQNFSTIGAAPAISISTTGAFVFASFNIRAKFNTTVTIKTNLTTSIGSINYDIGGTIQRLN